MICLLLNKHFFKDKGSQINLEPVFNLPFSKWFEHKITQQLQTFLSYVFWLQLFQCARNCLIHDLLGRTKGNTSLYILFDFSTTFDMVGQNISFSSITKFGWCLKGCIPVRHSFITEDSVSNLGLTKVPWAPMLNIYRMWSYQASSEALGLTVIRRWHPGLYLFREAISALKLNPYKTKIILVGAFLPWRGAVLSVIGCCCLSGWMGYCCIQACLRQILSPIPSSSKLATLIHTSATSSRGDVLESFK